MRLRSISYFVSEEELKAKFGFTGKLYIARVVDSKGSRGVEIDYLVDGDVEEITIKDIEKGLEDVTKEE